MGVIMLGGAEARGLAGALGCRWSPLADLGRVGMDTADTVVVFGAFDDVLAALRTGPARILWRPMGQPTPLPRRAPWVLRRLDLVVAPDDVVGRVVAAAGAPTTVLPPAVDTRWGPAADRLGSASAPWRIAVILDQLDHTAGAAMTLLGALARGRTRRCTGCAGLAPFRFSPVTAQPAAAEPCPCGGNLASIAPLDVQGYITVSDERRPSWTHEYLTGVRSWLELEDVVVLDDREVVEPRSESELMSSIADFDLHLSAGTGPSLPRGVFVAGAAGVPSIVPGYGAAAGVPWLRTCRYRTETLADDSLRVWLDLADAARLVVDLVEVAETRRLAAEAARSAVARHDVRLLAPRWRRILDQVGSAPCAGFSGRFGPRASQAAGVR